VIVLGVVAVEACISHLVDKPSVDSLIEVSWLQIKCPEPQKGSKNKDQYLDNHREENPPYPVIF
jgi:hypothetical protein